MTTKKELIPFKSQTGKTYYFPSEIGKPASVTDGILKMLKEGYNAYQISKVSSIRYQMVRNILIGKNLWKKSSK